MLLMMYMLMLKEVMLMMYMLMLKEVMLMLVISFSSAKRTAESAVNK